MAYDLSYSQSLIVAACLVLLAIICTRRGLQYGLLFVLLAGLFDRVLLVGTGRIPDITPERLVWPVVLLFFFVRWRRGEIDRFSFNWIEYALLTLMIVVLISTYSAGSYLKTWGSGTWDPDATKLQLRPLLHGFLYPLLTYAMARRAIQTDVQVRQFFIGIGLITVYLIITGLGEASSQHWLVFPQYILDPQLGIHFGWVRGPFLNASMDGLAIAMGIPILIWLFFTRSRLSSWLWLVAVVLAPVPLIFTSQRAVWFGAAAASSAVVVAWPQRRVILLGGLVLAVAVGSLALSNSPIEKRLSDRLADKATIDFRREMIKRSFILISQNPLTGVGFYQFEPLAAKLGSGSVYSHNTPLTLFVELGVVGFFPYLSIFTFFLLKSMNVYLQQLLYRPFITILWGMTMAYVIMAVSTDMLMSYYINSLFFASWGIVLEQIRRKKTVLRQVEFTGYQPLVSFI